MSNALEDFHQSAAISNVSGLLSRFVAAFDKEPMRGFIATALPSAEFTSWWLAQNRGRLSSSGKISIDWPTDTPMRVALQVDLCRELADSEPTYVYRFAVRHFYAANSTAGDFHKMGQAYLAPMLRDLQELAQAWRAPEALALAIRARPRSSDAVLDALLDEACAAFLDPAPQAHRRAVERLWDAWERAKTLHGSNKSTSAELMLDAAAVPGSAFRAMLAVEAKELTRIGNDFHIRHHETNRTPLNDPAQVDYLFHRMLAMLQLVVR